MQGWVARALFIVGAWRRAEALVRLRALCWLELSRAGELRRRLGT